jgi:EAL domain-containing protein (putative c-di-GMP-specific phosphodiesterase class I)
MLKRADPILACMVAVLSDYLRSESSARQRREAAFAALAGDAAGSQARLHRLIVEPAVATLRMQSDLQSAVADGELFMVYQPIRDLRAAGYPVAGFEALLRWTRNGQPISPAVLIPVAEACPLIHPIGDFVIRSAARDLAILRTRLDGNLFMSLNVAPRQIEEGNVVEALAAHAGSAGVSPAEIKLEITERAMLGGDKVGEWIAACHGIGAQIALDDFGTGFSNLESLHRHRVDVLKIDGSFVRGLPGDASSVAICRGMADLARALGMQVVAERVETEEQADLLATLGCTFAQGYFRGGQPRRVEEHGAGLA